MQIVKDGKSWPRKLEQDLDMFINSIQQAIAGLEADNLLHKEEFGRTCVYELNKDYFAYAELKAYLNRLLQAPPLQ
jgi:hypothetical protein